MKRSEVSEDQANDDQFYPPEFEALTPALFAAGLCGFDLCYYLINKGQSGTHKICSTHNDYRDAVKALEAFDPILRPHTEIRIGLLVEGPAIVGPVCHQQGRTGPIGLNDEIAAHKILTGITISPRIRKAYDRNDGAKPTLE